MIFFFNDTATTEIYTLSLHDALPIFSTPSPQPHIDTARSSSPRRCARAGPGDKRAGPSATAWRSEEHTSELQSRQYLVCRLLLEKKKMRKSPTALAELLTITLQNSSH